jgi:HSP20 family protein
MRRHDHIERQAKRSYRATGASANAFDPNQGKEPPTVLCKACIFRANRFKRSSDMTEAATKLATKNDGTKPEAGRQTARNELWPFAQLRDEIDRLFNDFGIGPWRSPFRRSVFDVEPFWRGEMTWGKLPAVDIAETEKAYEIAAELPGMDEKNVEVKYANGTLTIKGEKKDDKEEQKENYYLSERNYGSFLRAFRVPEGVHADKIEASFKNGILTVTLPKTPEAQRKERRVEVKRS